MPDDPISTPQRNPLTDWLGILGAGLMGFGGQGGQAIQVLSQARERRENQETERQAVQTAAAVARLEQSGDLSGAMRLAEQSATAYSGRLPQVGASFQRKFESLTERIRQTQGVEAGLRSVQAQVAPGAEKGPLSVASMGELAAAAGRPVPPETAALAGAAEREPSGPAGARFLATLGTQGLGVPSVTKPAQLDISNIPEHVRVAAWKARINLPDLVNRYNAQDQRALFEFEALQRATAPSERTKLTSEQVLIAQRLFGRPVTYANDLSGKESGLVQEQEDIRDVQKRAGVMVEIGQAEAFNTRTFESELYDPNSVRSGAQRVLPSQVAQGVKVINSLEVQVRTLRDLFQRIAAPVGPGQNIRSAINAAIARGLATNEDLAAFDAIVGPLGLQLTRMYQGARPSDLDLVSALLALPTMERDNVATGTRRLDALLGQITISRASVLGLPLPSRTPGVLRRPGIKQVGE